MEELVTRLDAARRLPRGDPARLPACCAARDALFAFAGQGCVDSLAALDAAAALRRAGTSDGTRVAALALLCHERQVPHLPLLFDAACAAAAPHSEAPPFVADVARSALLHALLRGEGVYVAAAAAMAPAVEAMPLPADGDDARRRAWRAQVLELLRKWHSSGVSSLSGAQWAARREALLGAVLWQALGDALGFLVEGRTAGEAAVYTRDFVRTGAVLRYGLSVAHANASFPRYVPADGSAGPVTVAFGQYTDDTQCMRELLRSIAATGGVLHGGHFARRVSRLFANAGLLAGHAPAAGGCAIVGYGASTRAAAQAIADGGRDAWKCSGQDSPGNGGCMRAGPLGALMHSYDAQFQDSAAEAVAHAAALQCHVTHARPEAKAAAAAVAVATHLAAASAGSPLDAAAFVAHVVGAVNKVHPGVAVALAALPGDLAAPTTDAARAAIVARGAACRDGIWHDGLVISSSAVQACLWALYAFLKHPDDPLAAICLAIEGGGDTDTTAAMAGAVAGARNGTRTLPRALAARLNDAGKHDASALASLVDELLTLSDRNDGRGVECGPTVPRLYGKPGINEDGVLQMIAMLRAGGPYPDTHDLENEHRWELSLVGRYHGDVCTDLRGHTPALFSALADNSTLRSLSISCCPLDDANGGAVELADALRINGTLEKLTLLGCNVSDAGAAALAGALRVNSALRRLDLTANSFGWPGVLALREALGVNATLQSLRVSREGYFSLNLVLD